MPMRKGPRSTHTPLTWAVVSVFDEQMDELGLTRNALAARVVGVSRTQVYDILDGKRVMDLGEFHAISAALGMEPTAVMVRAQEVARLLEVLGDADVAAYRAFRDELRRQQGSPPPPPDAEESSERATGA